MRNKYIKKFLFKSKLFLFLFQNYIFFVHCSNYISMKLKNFNNEQIKTIPDNSFSFEHFINSTIKNLIYTTIKIGKPIQEVKTWIDSDEYSYYIYKNTCILDSDYNENISLSYEPNEDKTFFYKGYGKAIYVNETLTLKKDIIGNNNQEIEITKFPIMFMKDPKNDERFNLMHSTDDITENTCATIGFKYLDNYNDKTSKDFTKTLKEKEIIDDYTVFIEYDKDGNEDYLIIGGYPEEVFKNKYSVKYQHTAYIKFYYQFINQWGLNFDNIYSGAESKIYQIDAGFHYNLGVIYGVKEYQSLIENKFFNYYINLNICEKVSYKDYTGYICNKEKFTINEMKKFPELKFIKIDFEENFLLTYEDLFFTKGDKVFFLIVFHKILKEIWELGKPFLKKYEFAFNFDSKLLWYYKKMDNNKINDIKNDKSFLFKDNILFICFIIALSLILGGLCFLLGRVLYNQNKKKLIKAEELDQDFNYENYENNGNKNIN